MSSEGGQVVHFPKVSLLRRKRSRTTAAPSSSPTTAESQNNYFVKFPYWRDNGSASSSGSYVSSSSSSRSSNANSYTFQEFDHEQPTIVTQYSMFLLTSVVLFYLYLLMPKGLRQYMFNAYPKRYSRSSADREIQVLGRKSPRVVIRKTMSASTSTGTGTRKSGNSSGLSHRYSSSEAVSRGSTSSGMGRRMNIGVSRVAQASRFDPNHHDLLLSNSASSDGTAMMGTIGMESRVSSGITDGRMALQPAGSSEASSVSANTPDASQSSGGATWTTWGPKGRPPSTFQQSYYAENDDGMMDEFKIDSDQEETIDFFTPDAKMQAFGSEAGLPSPSLVDIESLACYSHSSPTPSGSGGVIITEPSPVHPNSFNGHRVPSQMVLSSTLTSLREPGIRLHAHGTQCEPRRIWIQLNVHTEMIEWKTENVTNKSDGPKFVLGPVHTIPLRDVVFVDVGKTTAALRLLSEQDASNDMCFSILTKNGSLDLNAANKLERDALVSCFCLVLDTIYLDLDGDGNINTANKTCWRDVHSSGTSIASRSTQDQSSYTGGTSDVYSKGQSSLSNFSPNQSDVFAGIEDL